MADQKINGTQESYEKILRRSLHQRMGLYLRTQKGITNLDRILILDYLDSLKTKEYNWGIIYVHPIETITQRLVDGQLHELEKDTLSTQRRKLTTEEIEKYNL